MDSQSGSDQNYWGSYHFMYGPLADGEILILEEAIFARRLGRYEEARQIWDDKLPPSCELPVLTIERAELEARLMRHRFRLEILETFFNSQEKWRRDPSEQEINLITVLLAAAKIEVYGTLRPALMEVRRIQSMWQDRSVEELSLIEVACVSECIRIMEKCKRKSNWLDDKNDPPCSRLANGPPWQVIHAIQEVWRQVNGIHECLSLLPARQTFLDKPSELGYLLGIVEVLESRSSTNHDQAWLELINARLVLARYLLEFGRLDNLSNLLHEVGSILEDLPWIKPSDAPMLWLQRLQISSLAPRNMCHLQARLDLALTLRGNDDTLQETSVLLDIHLILNEVDGLERDSQWVALNAANLSRRDEIDSDLGNALMVSHNLSTFGKTDNTMTTASEYLHRLELFDSRFPEFDVPLELQSLYQSASEATLKLGKGDSYLHYEAKLASAWANCPILVELETLRYRAKPCEVWPRDFLIVVHQWMKIDYENGVLSASKVGRLLLLEQTSGPLEQIVNQHMAAEFGPGPLEELAIKMYGNNDPVDASAWQLHFGHYEDWLWNSPVEVDRSLRHTVLLDMELVRDARLREYHGTKMGAEDLVDQDFQLDLHLTRIRQRIRLASFRKRVDKGAVGASQLGNFSDKWHLMSLTNGLAHSIKAVQKRILTDEHLLRVQTWMDKAYSETPDYLRPNRLIALASKAQAMQHRYNIFGATAPDAALGVYSRYDEIHVGQRRERSVLRGASNLLARAQISSSLGGSDYYLAAMACCIEALGPARMYDRWQRMMGHGQRRAPLSAPAAQRSTDTLMREFIDWAQKRKARSVTEVLGSDIIIPQRSLADLNDDEMAKRLLRKEAELQMILDSDGSDPIELSRQLESIRREMRECASLEQVMNFRDGVAITSSQIQALSRNIGPNVVMVDFVYLPTSSTAIANEFLCMVYKDGILHSSTWVSPEMSHDQLTRWVRAAFDDEEEPLATDDAEDDLAELSPLLNAVTEATEPGDTILLCPTRVLFKIPLHAIPVNGQPLIERNPVVYAQSLTILYLSGISASSLTEDTPADPIAIQALSDTESALPTAPTMAFAQKIGAPLLTGPELTKPSFLRAIKESSLINFYGHVWFDAHRPLESYMAIRGLDSERITARDIFDIRLRSGAHVNMIGCKSGMSEVRSNDDQFGLTTALLYAGAGSILSALWEIRMEDAHEFQEAFYDEILAQLGEDARRQASEGGAGAEKFVNTAKALQRAMVKVSKNEDGTRKAPYHWAAFMLQGDWKALSILSFS